MTDLSAVASVLVITDLSGPLAAEALALADAHEILTCIGEADGMARNGKGLHQRIFIRHGGNAFYGTELDMLLRSGGARSVVLAGETTSGLILDAADALARGYAVFILATPQQAAELEPLAAALFAGREAPVIIGIEDLAKAWNGTEDKSRTWHAEGKDGALLPTLEERIDPAHTAYVMIDVQNDFCTPRNGPDPSFSMIRNAMPNVEALLASARAAGSTVVFVQVENGPLFRGPGSPRPLPGDRQGQVVFCAGAAEFAGEKFRPENWPELCMADSWGIEFVDTIAPLPGEIVLRKHRFSAFIDTGLDVMLRQRGIRTIVLVGFITNVCIESTARDASMLDFYVVVAEDGVGVKDTNRALHESSLEEIRGRFGLVVPAQRILDGWDKYRSEKAA